ncbi:MAG TPA: selenocysteine-specific translation elongation factor [Kofleriaceae bacterium]|nr:selenocysteine-specific translation elongation factor [Kofleriaceae bacterium]
MAHPIVLGTAGHIDHGKTSLVRALTGIDTDRLPVEKARGITTELGFARLDLGDRRIAVVDVPGHERFVKSMVAGATGLDLVCLVIAADEGVMPQTREHLDICELLGVRRGLIVVTKRDLVDDEWLTLVTQDIRAAVAGTFLAAAPIVTCSTKTGAGLDELRAAIAALIDDLPPREATGVFRLPIDRVFTVKGFGTIVTGTVLGGQVALGDEMTVLPTGLTARVRGIEVHGEAVERAIAGHRAALNLGGIAVDDLARGDLLAHAGRVAASHILDVELRYLRTAPGPLGPRTKVLVHHGTTQVLATLALVGRSTLAPGQPALAQLRIDAQTPLAALPGDHFIVRGFVATASHGTTIGGGRIVRVLAPRARKGAAHAEAIEALAAARLDQRISLDIKAAAFAGLGIAELVRRLGQPPETLAPALANLVAGGDLLLVGTGDHAHYVHATAVAALEARIAASLGATSPASPASPTSPASPASPTDGIGREELRTRLPAALPVRAYEAIVAGLASRGKLIVDGERVRRVTATKPGATLSTAETELLARFQAWALEPPRPAEVPTTVGRPAAEIKPLLDRLLAGKWLVKIKPDLYMHPAIVADLRTRLIAFLDVHKTIDAQQWKELTGASRKFTIPLAEYFDGEKLTLRIGDLRRRR